MKTARPIAAVLCILLPLAAVWLGTAPYSEPFFADAPKAVHEESRSGQWPAVRKAHLEKEPEWAVCGSKGTADNELNVHHVLPFHKYPDKELDQTNLITLCREHHFTFGHLCEWSSWNTRVREDAAEWRRKIKDRP